jgi:hypothetical protein
MLASQFRTPSAPATAAAVPARPRAAVRACARLPLRVVAFQGVAEGERPAAERASAQVANAKVTFLLPMKGARVRACVCVCVCAAPL